MSPVSGVRRDGSVGARSAGAVAINSCWILCWFKWYRWLCSPLRLVWRVRVWRLGVVLDCVGGRCGSILVP